ncbi:MAG: hypothetical protein ACREA0_32380 [bacterium]
MKLICLALLVLPVAASCSNQDTTTPLEQPLLADARAITPGGIYTEALREVMSIERGDVIYTVPVNDYQILARLRPDASPHLYATSCDALALVELPEGWEGSCLERSVDGQRLTGVFTYGEVSE